MKPMKNRVSYSKKNESQNKLKLEINSKILKPLSKKEKSILRYHSQNLEPASDKIGPFKNFSPNHFKNIKTSNEAIIRLIIEDLISLVITKSRIKIIYTKIGLHCSNYCMKLLNPFLSTNFLYNDLQTENKMFYNINNKLNKDTWCFPTEPKPSILDRYCENKKIIKNENLSSKNDINEYINNDDSKEYNKKMKTSLFYNEKNILSNFNLNNKNEEEFKIVIKRKRKVDVVKNRVEIETDKIIELPSYDITTKDKCYQFNFSDESNKLRKEFEDLPFKKKQENNMLNERNKKKYSILFHKKVFQSDKLTFDSNGNIIKINLPQIEKLNQDFCTPTNKITTKIFSPEKKKESIISKRKSSIKLLDNIIKNKIDDFEIKAIAKKYKKRTSKILAGTNFSKINPEIGVIIRKENNSIPIKKEGGFEYYNKYSKYSMGEFSKLIDSSKNIFNYDKNNVNDLSNNYSNYYNGYNEEFNEKNNPLLQNAIPVQINNNDNLKIKSAIKKNLSLNDIHINNKMQINLKKNIRNLSSIFSDDNNFSEDKIKRKNIFSPITRKLPKLNRKIIIRNKELMEGRAIINKFNIDIIKNKQWGNQYNQIKMDKRIEFRNNLRNISRSSENVNSVKRRIVSSFSN